MLSNRHIPNTKTVMSVAGSVAASAMLIRTIAYDFLPREARSFIFSSLHNLSRLFSSQITIVIEEFQGLSSNQVFEAADTYLGTTMTSTTVLRISKSENAKKFLLGVGNNEDIVDVFDNVEMRWKLISTRRHSRETRSYELSFHKKHKDKIMELYLPLILEKAKSMKEETKATGLHIVKYRKWDSKTINLDHPMRFDTLAMDSDLKKAIVDDLDSFVKGKELYRRMGKNWRRGYLLYGPPGTGKSSLIAAMAKYLNYNIYDMDLTDVWCNSMLRGLMLRISNRSIAVFEDIDCTVTVQNGDSAKIGGHEVTLSGLLNFMDGLLSCCGEEQIMIFTTNHRDRIHPALLRPGRMDMHIHLSYCTVSTFRQLAYTLHGMQEHELFREIEGLIGEIQVTPAEVSGELMKIKDIKASLQGLVKYLQDKKMKQGMADVETKLQVQENLSVSDNPARVALTSTRAPSITRGSTRGSSRTFYRGRGRARRGRGRIIQ